MTQQNKVEAKENGCSTEPAKLPYGCSGIYHQPNFKFEFEEGKCYKDGKYFGDITEIEADKIVVGCANGNKYMDAQIIVFNITNGK